MLFQQFEPLSEIDQKQLSLLRNYLKTLEKVCVAYSGGVDSTLVATIAQEQLGSNAIAITGVSPALAPNLLIEAREQASWIGIQHKELQTQELQDPSYSNNPQNRCYACKKELHSHLQQIAREASGYKVIDGVNHDDLNDHRPGIVAAKEADVLSPLAEMKIGKTSVRKISKALGLPWWNKPAQPCLASRFPYGEQITLEKLQQVAKAENILRENGFREVRVRSQGLNARIELPSDQINKFFERVDRERLIKDFLSLGFTTVSIDLEGLVSGKLNRHINN